LIEPRFPGGTSSAVAGELAVISRIARPRVHAITSRMFPDGPNAPVIDTALDRLGLDMVRDPAHVSADIVVLHNPAFLKFQDALAVTIAARRLMVVTHENFLRPSGQESFDVAGCLAQIARASLARERILCPVSAGNRQTVMDWLERAPREIAACWTVLEDDWFNICDFDIRAPVETPRDRRGRLSRPGFEKFPREEVLEQCFAPHARINLLLGADSLMPLADEHPHWTLLPFRAMEVEAFFEEIDFMVYFTSDTWRESFGRVLAEAIAAGKVVISDAQTAAPFGGGVVAARPGDVNRLIAGFVADPDSYRAQVERAQCALSRYSGAAFELFFTGSVLSSRPPIGTGAP